MFMVKRKRRETGLLPRKRLKKQRKSRERANNVVDNDTSKSMINNVFDPQHSIASASIKSRAIFVLENASLEKGFVRKRRKILSAEYDAEFLSRQGKNLNNYRPDILQMALLDILGSPLNDNGLVGAVYVKTDSGVLFEVKPHTRIPRTSKRFCGLMLDLLEKSCIRDKDTGEVLLQVLKEPLTHYIPENSHVIGLSYCSQKVVDLEDYLPAASDDLNLVFVVGAMVDGKVSKESKNDYISVSEYRLSTKSCIGIICDALEHKWNAH